MCTAGLAHFCRLWVRWKPSLPSPATVALRKSSRFGNSLPARFRESRWSQLPWELGAVNIPPNTASAELEVRTATTDCGWVELDLLEFTAGTTLLMRLAYPVSPNTLFPKDAPAKAAATPLSPINPEKTIPSGNIDPPPVLTTIVSS